MSHWPCDVPDCTQPALIGRQGSCAICADHFCFHHANDADKHPCAGGLAEIDRELLYDKKFYMPQRKELFAAVNVQTLVEEAQQVRPGHSCQGPAEVKWDAKEIIYHNGHMHVILTFDDGVKWLARIQKRMPISPPPHVHKLAKDYEVATFRVLYDAGIKVPQVWRRPLGDDNLLNYFFIEFAPGQAFNDYARQPMTYIPTERDLQIVDSFARYMIALEKVTFDSIGSPTFDEAGQIIIGASHQDLSPIAHPPYFLGPFKTPRERYTAYFDTVLTAIAEDRWCTPDKSLRFYLSMLEAKRLVEECEEMSVDTGPFVLMHGEPKGDHFLLDEANEITAMLDWEWSTTTSKANAFAAPFCFTPVDLHKGNKNDLGPLELALADAYRKHGRDDLAQFVVGGKKYQRLDYLLLGVCPSQRFMTALRRCFEEPEDDWPKTTAEWTAYAMKRFQGDDRLAKLAAADQARTKSGKDKSQTSSHRSEEDAKVKGEQRSQGTPDRGGR